MKLGIMQPYFLPYIGYFQLIAAVDRFVLYDNIKYTKKGWINRNRFLLNGRDETFTVPLQAGSDFLDVRDRRVAADFDRRRLLARIGQAYRKAPFFEPAFAVFEKAVSNPEANLFAFIHRSILDACGYLGIATPIVPSSEIPVDHGLHGQDRVLAICRQQGARVYVNAIGGQELYSPAAFEAQGIELRFLKSRPVEYEQFGAPFVPWLSILDVMMFNSPQTIRGWLEDGFDLVGEPA
jgi:hypothetical protein